MTKRELFEDDCTICIVACTSHGSIYAPISMKLYGWDRKPLVTMCWAIGAAPNCSGHLLTHLLGTNGHIRIAMKDTTYLPLQSSNGKKSKMIMNISIDPLQGSKCLMY